MRKTVEFELLDPFFSGGVRIADNFLESEGFIRGSVLRAAFANDILLQCPFADKPSKDGKLNFVEIKDKDGKCESCPNKKICENFSDMYFSYAYCGGAFPAPFTARVCKANGIKHPLQDVIVQSGKLECTECTSGIKRMEGLKGFVRKAENGKYEAVKPEYVLTTHTSVDYNSHTALDGSLYSVKAIKKGQKFIAVIDDCDSGMIYEGKIIYAGKFSSAGFGKMKISSITDAAEASSQSVIDSVEDFENRLKVKNKAALLFMSDALLDFGEISTNHTKEEYLKIWQNALFGAENAPILVEKVYAQTQIYSGYDTSKKWGEWKQKEPQLLVLKGTSVLLDISDREQAVELLAKLENDGIGQKTKDGFGQIKVCHDIHKLGVGNDE